MALNVSVWAVLFVFAYFCILHLFSKAVRKWRSITAMKEYFNGRHDAVKDIEKLRKGEMDMVQFYGNIFLLWEIGLHHKYCMGYMDYLYDRLPDRRRITGED